MSIDQRKLARLQEQAAELRTAIDGQFQRYRAKLEDAEWSRRAALTGAPPSVQHLRVPELRALAPEAREQLGIDEQHMNDAARHVDAAAEINRAMDRRKTETAGFLRLVGQLEKYASGNVIPYA